MSLKLAGLAAAYRALSLSGTSSLAVLMRSKLTGLTATSGALSLSGASSFAVLMSCKLAVFSAALGANCLLCAGCCAALMLGTRSFGSFKSANLTYVLGIEGVISLSDVNLAAASVLSGVLIFGLAPYEQYREYFNVYTVVGLSPDSGVGTVNTIREARFGSQYGLQGSGKIAPDAATCFEYACKAPTVDENNINKTLIVLIENSTEYDGICYMYGDGSAIALCPMSDDAYPYDFRGIVQHEAGGHGFGKLGDEYIYHNAFISTCTCDCCGHVDEFNAMKARGWYENLSLTGNMYDVPWSHFIFDPKYSNVVDIYEGGYFHTRGVFRSESISCMNNNIPYYSAVSREAIVKRIMEYAGEEYSFEAFKEKDVMTASSQVEVKSAGSYMDAYYPARHQHGPVFMGEKPEFKK